jgi:hypothetical protein
MLKFIAVSLKLLHRNNNSTVKYFIKLCTNSAAKALIKFHLEMGE